MNFRALLLGGALCASLLTPAWAGGSKEREQALRALESGEIVPMQKALAQIEKEVPGHVTEIELDRDQGRWVYKFKLLRTGGEQVRLVVHAGSGEILQTTTKAPKNKN